jgi:hypothetical protein
VKLINISLLLCLYVWCRTSTTCFREILQYVGFGVLVAVSVKMAAFWFVAPCSVVEVNLYQTTRHYKPEDRHLGAVSTLNLQLQIK